MAAPARSWAAELLHFWFHRLTPQDWFGASNQIDTALRLRFWHTLDMLGSQPARDFLGDDGTALAAIILFDQVPRNIHRDSAAAFATDPLARAICREMIEAGRDRHFTFARRQFLYMPLMHSELVVDQQLSLALFARLPRRYGWPWAVGHHAAIARFGRFPHRNEVLGRTSSVAEEAAIARGVGW